MAFLKHNANPIGNRTGDCTVRAIAKALGQDWERTYVELAFQGFLMADMPSANHVWGAYLKNKGYTRNVIPDSCPDCYTVADFAREHPTGTYVLAISGHVVCVCNGHWYDTWDSGGEIPVYYWERKDG